LALSTYFIALAETWVTERIVEPRLKKVDGDVFSQALEKISPAERRGLLYTLVSTVVFSAIML
jgi:aminobenzoyl-glutamate transport protein